MKKFLNNVMQEELSPIRARRKEYEQRIGNVYDILKAGSEVAKEEAAKTLSEVKHAMKIDYFDTPEFLEEQVKKYSSNHKLFFLQIQAIHVILYLHLDGVSCMIFHELLSLLTGKADRTAGCPDCN